MKINFNSEYPNDGDEKLDFGFIKNNIIAKLPSDYVEVNICKTKWKIAPQLVIDKQYDSFIQRAHKLMPCKYFDSIAFNNFSDNDIINFLKKTVETDRLQKNNILISNAVWNNVLELSKTNICGGYFQRLIKGKQQVNFSTLETFLTNSGGYASTMDTIQFRFDDMFQSNPGKVTKEIYEKFQKMFYKRANSNDVDAIFKLAELIGCFSIHKYFLPNGPKEVDDAYLLLRYDASRNTHYNKSMPPLYRKVYSYEVHEPHFHFTRGFGSIYKLTSKYRLEDFGAGYAIGISDLKNYLEKLNNQDFVDEEERKLYMENDFGMPFLKMYNIPDGKKLTESMCHLLEIMILDDFIYEPKSHLLFAYEFMSLCNGTRELTVSDEKLEFRNPYITRDNGRDI